MPAQTWQQWVQNFRPAWMGSRARAFFGALGYVLGDKSDSEALASLKEEIPLTATDPASLALALSERGLEPGTALSTSSLRALAASAPALNRFRGRPLGLLVALYYAGFQGAVVVQQNGLGFQITATPDLDDLRDLVALPSWVTRTVLGNRPDLGIPWWTFDFDDNYWQRFAVLFPVDVTNPSLGTAANLARIQRVIKTWRPAKATCVGVYVCTAGRFVGWPKRAVKDGGTVGPSTVAFYAGA